MLVCTDLMIGKDQGIGNDDVLATSGGEDDNLGNIIWRQGFDALVDGIGFGFVTTEAHDGEFLSCGKRALLVEGTVGRVREVSGVEQ